MVACDVYRPAAIKQLETIGKSLNIDVYSEEGNKNVVEVVDAISELSLDKLVTPMFSPLILLFSLFP